jgi:hypothetical protein
LDPVEQGPLSSSSKPYGDVARSKLNQDHVTVDIGYRYRTATESLLPLPAVYQPLRWKMSFTVVEECLLQPFVEMMAVAAVFRSIRKFRLLEISEKSAWLRGFYEM